MNYIDDLYEFEDESFYDYPSVDFDKKSEEEIGYFNCEVDDILEDLVTKSTGLDDSSQLPDGEEYGDEQLDHSEFAWSFPYFPSLIKRSTNRQRIVREALKRFRDPVIRFSYKYNIPWVFSPDPRPRPRWSRYSILRAASRRGKGSWIRSYMLRHWNKALHDLPLIKRQPNYRRYPRVPKLGKNFLNFPKGEYVTWLGINIHKCHLFVNHVLYKAGFRPYLSKGRKGSRRYLSAKYIHKSRYSGPRWPCGHKFKRIAPSAIQPGDIFTRWNWNRSIAGHTGIIIDTSPNSFKSIEYASLPGLKIKLHQISRTGGARPLWKYYRVTN